MKKHILLVAGLLLLVMFFILKADLSEQKPDSNSATQNRETVRPPESPPARTPAECCKPEELLQDKDSAPFAVYVNGLWHGAASDMPAGLTRLETPAQAVYVSVRAQGKRLAEAWETRGSTADALAGAIQTIRSGQDPSALSRANVLEIALSHDYREFFLNQPQSRRSLLSNIHRGARGLEITWQDKIERYSPTYTIATNRNNERLLELFREKYHLTEEQMNREARVFAFDAEQVLVRLGDKPSAVLLERGNVYVDPSEVTRENIQKTALLAGNWLRNNVHEDGRMTYKYWPSAVEESKSNNMIRQWMATVALIRFGLDQGKEEIVDLAEKNIGYNLKQFYSEENGFGLVDCQGTVKLGALGLGCLAIFEHPRRSQWARQEFAMGRTIDSLWHEDGSFTSFYRPKGDNRNQNFYPGEALLYWANLYAGTADPALLERFMKSFAYYRDWHLNEKNRNPAFVPWHTQAYYLMWKATKDDQLASFIFEMNDWLVPVQQWPDNPPYRDILGRFYAPDKPYGPPHSSSTGVYLEGLIDAFELAKTLRDDVRAEVYRRTINRGLRSVMQLQFVDDADMFYVSPEMRRYVEGGIRSTEYDNEIRCDNIQHNLMALLKILRVFQDSDYGRCQ